MSAPLLKPIAAWLPESFRYKLRGRLFGSEIRADSTAVKFAKSVK